MRKFFLILFCLLGVTARADYVLTNMGQTNTVSKTVSFGTSTISVSYSNGTLSWSGEAVQSQFGLGNSGIWVRPTAGLNEPYGNPAYIDISPVNTTSYTGSAEVTEGSWVQIGVRFVGSAVGGDVVDVVGYFRSGTPCPSVTYSKTAVNAATNSTKQFVLMAEPSDPNEMSTEIETFSVQPGGRVLKQGTVPNLCGTVKLYELDAEGMPQPYESPIIDTDLPTLPPVTQSPDPTAAPTAPNPTAPTAPINAGSEEVPVVLGPNPTNSDIWSANQAKGTRAIEKNTEYTGKILEQINQKAGYTNDRLKRIDDNIAKMERNDQDRVDREKDIAELVPDVETMIARGEQAADEAKDVLGTIPSAGTLSVPTSTPDFEITLGGQTFDANPFRSDRFGSVAAFIRKLIGWLLVLGYGGWCALQVRECVSDMLMVPQAKGNTVAGTGGQLTAFLAAAIIAAAISAGCVVLVAWKDDALGDFTFLGMLGTDPLNGGGSGFAVSRGIWMIDQVIPIKTALAVVVARVTFQWTVLLSIVGVGFVIKFIVP